MLNVAIGALFAPGTLTSPDTTPTVRDTTGMLRPAGVTVEAMQDTVRPRRRSVELDAAYEKRLRIHYYASYATIPLFVAQTVAGNQLYHAPSMASAPGWALGSMGVALAGYGVMLLGHE